MPFNPSPESIRAIINAQQSQQSQQPVQYPAGSYRMMPSHGQQPDKTWYRDDGSLKGYGFLGPLKLGNGSASEYSIAESDNLKDKQGNYLDYPSIVPTLTRDEVQSVLQAAGSHNSVPESVIDKATTFALQRRAQGLPFFARPDEMNSNLYSDMPRSNLSNYITTNYNRMQAPNPNQK